MLRRIPLILLLSVCAPTAIAEGNSLATSETLVDSIDTRAWKEKSFRVSADSRRIAYRALQNNKEFAVVDNKAGKRYDGIATILPVFSPNSRHVAYIAERQGRQFLVKDGREGTPHAKILSAPHFSPDSQHNAYVGQSVGKSALVIDGKEHASHLAYRAGHGDELFAVVDGKQQKSYDAVGIEGPSFSPGGKHVVYRALTDTTMRVVADGVEGPPYDLILNTIKFDGDDSLRYVAFKNDKAYFVTHDLRTSVAANAR